MLARLFFAAMLLVLATPLHAAESVRVRAGVHDGFGRLVFDWKSPVEFEAKAEGERLVVSFARPFAADYDEVRRHLERYLGPAVPGADGRSVLFALLRPVAVRAAVIDGAVAVDLRDEKPGAGKPVETIELRTGVHDGFSRLVFDWRRDVPYKLEVRDGVAVATFSRPAAIDAGALERDRPPYVEGFASRIEAGKTVAELRLAPGARVRHFRDGARIALDVLAPRKQVELEPPKPQVTAKAPEAPKPQAKETPKPQAKEAPPAPKADAPQAKPQAEAAATPAPDPRAPRLSVAADGKATRLEFAWPQPTPAAVFERAGWLWIVFAERAELDLKPLKAADRLVMAAEQTPNPRGAALRLRLRDGAAASVRRDGGVWTVRLGPPLPPTSTVTATAEPSAAPTSRVFLSASEPGAPIELADPEVGDRLIVVPTLAGGQGAPAPREFVDFKLLPSAQGVALSPRVDGLQVAARKDGIAVTTAAGLALSEPPPIKTQAQEAIAGALERPLMDLAAWSRQGKDFVKERQALERAVSQTPKAARNAARWELAKFLFANALATEALAELELIQEGDPNASRDPTFRAVRGAALLLAGRPAQAADELAHAELDRYADVALWRGAAFAAERRWNEADQQFAMAVAGFKAMPASLRERLLLAWAKAAVEAGRLESADLALNLIKELPKSPALEAQTALLTGRAAELRREPDVALEQYAAAAESEYRPVRGRAALALTELRLKRNEIDVDGALAELERLHFAWRGDEFEVTLMRRLAELRFAKQDYFGGLDLLRQAVTYFPKNPVTKELAQEMTRVFGELFQDGNADALEPVNALALYYEFKELTPAGAAGDAMIQKLADRLVGVDLLEQAAKLLDHQVTYRLRGPERARVGARLAVIQLLDKQPQEALASLEKTESPKLDPPLEAERRQLAARAYADLGQSAEALRRLEGDASAAAGLLRADIYWREQKWPEAAGALRALLASRDDGGQPLSELEQAQVVKLAVALYMGGDAAGVEALRRRFGARMAAGKHAESFSLLTSEIDPSKIEFRKLAGAIARIDELEAFMASYRTKLAQKSLSAIN
jgi:hypothetical protein